MIFMHQARQKIEVAKLPPEKLFDSLGIPQEILQYNAVHMKELESTFGRLTSFRFLSGSSMGFSAQTVRWAALYV